MADISLAFDSGIKTFELTDGKGHSVEVSFNPYDTIFINRFAEAEEKLNEKQAELKNIKEGDWKSNYNTIVKIDNEMREIIDGIFETPICDKLFKKQTVSAIGNGFPVWANILYAIADNLYEGGSAEMKKTKERMKKYSEKYKRK